MNSMGSQLAPSPIQEIEMKFLQSQIEVISELAPY